MPKKPNHNPKGQQASKSASVNNATTETSKSTVRCAPQTQRTERPRTYFTERSIKWYVKDQVAHLRNTLKGYRGAIPEDWGPANIALQFIEFRSGYRFIYGGGWIEIDENAYRYATDAAKRAGVLAITYSEFYMDSLLAPY